MSTHGLATERERDAQWVARLRLVRAYLPGRILTTQRKGRAIEGVASSLMGLGLAPPSTEKISIPKSHQDSFS